MLVILLSIHALPIDMPKERKSYVPRRNGAIQKLVHTSSMYLKYTTYMKEVDVANQLRAFYSC